MMMTDKQFDMAFAAAGGWFFLTQYETIKNWKKDRESLAEYVFEQGFDSKIKGSKARVAGALRIIGNGREEEAFIRIRDSARICSRHPEARAMAEKLLNTIQKENQKEKQARACEEKRRTVSAAYMPGRVSGKIKTARPYRPRRIPGSR